MFIAINFVLDDGFFFFNEVDFRNLVIKELEL